MAGVDPRIDPQQAESSAKRCLAISDQVRNIIKEMRTTADSVPDWTGKTRMAMMTQVEDQRSSLDLLSSKLEQGSNALTRTAHGFTDVDTTGTAGMNAGAGNGQSSLNGTINFA